MIGFDQWDVSQNNVNRDLKNACALSSLIANRLSAMCSLCEEAQASLQDSKRRGKIATIS